MNPYIVTVFIAIGLVMVQKVYKVMAKDDREAVAKAEERASWLGQVISSVFRCLFK